jgi:hypothetical protein
MSAEPPIALDTMMRSASCPLVIAESLTVFACVSQISITCRYNAVIGRLAG